MKSYAFLVAVLLMATGLAVAVEPATQATVVRSADGAFQSWTEESIPAEASGRLVLGRSSFEAQVEDLVVWERTEAVHNLTVLQHSSEDSLEMVEASFTQMEIDFSNPQTPTWVAVVNGEAQSGVLAITADLQGSRSGSLMMWQYNESGELELIVELALDDTDSLIRGGILRWDQQQATTSSTTVQTSGAGLMVATVNVDLVDAAMDLVSGKDHCSCLPVNGSCMPKKCDLGSTCSTPGNYCKWTKAVAPA